MSHMDRVKRKLLDGEIKYLDAIEALQELFGLSPREAEEIVEKWENEKP